MSNTLTEQMDFSVWTVALLGSRINVYLISVYISLQNTMSVTFINVLGCAMILTSVYILFIFSFNKCFVLQS